MQVVIVRTDALERVPPLDPGLASQIKLQRDCSFQVLVGVSALLVEEAHRQSSLSRRNLGPQAVELDYVLSHLLQVGGEVIG